MTSRRRLPSGPILLDASFVLALLDGDDRAARFDDVLSHAVITAVNLGEVLHTLAELAGLDPHRAAADLDATGLQAQPVLPTDAEHFVELKRLDATARRAAGPQAAGTLSLGDICCLAHAWTEQLPVLTGDKHWLALAEAGLPVPVLDFRDPALRP
ncbi:hypothetical protein GCM10012275_31920 [Longimycelium tulufanense]|uniref:PIN domain-containing protein n=1 Tax=Longimycelium tulufanense TaxID=907463 RepID=A0A8J3FUW0_9PSEU|nr:PIN domain-containing protein [Longimycelium tulufanense]GGM58321.1 hypothetical protein GCM10012275_31920 [Longimycelium tulufanense]